MNEQTYIDHGLIESILSTLNLSEKEEADITLLAQKYPSESLTPDFRMQNVQTAYHIKKFTDQMPGGFFIYRADETAELLYANASILHLYNCDTMAEFKELTGNSFKGMVHPEDLDRVEKSIEEQIEQSCYDLDYVEYRIIQKGGNILWLEDYGHFIHSKSAGDIFYVFVSDATERKNLQDKEREDMLNRTLERTATA